MVITINITQLKIANWDKPVINLEDKPKLTAQDLKASFDSNSNQLKNSFNGMIDLLSGENASENICIKTISGSSAKNIQEALYYLADTVTKIDPYIGAPVAISQGGTGEKDSQNALYNLGAKPNKNIARNGYFIGGGSDGKFPINQRKKKSYGIGYSIDGWKMNDYGTISILEDCIEITASGGLAIFEQVIENPQRFSNSKLTFSTLAQRVTGDGRCYITSVVNTFTGEGEISDNKSISHFTEISSDELTNLRIVFAVSDGCTARFYGAKIEDGESQTLARQKEDGSWELLEKPDYASELLKCQRYYQIYSSAENRPKSYIDCRPVMRKSDTGDVTQGTIQIDDMTYYYNSAEL